MLAIAGACARAPSPPSMAVNECRGKLYLDVHNPLALSIDIYEGDRMKRDDAKHVGTATPGDTRLPIAHPLLRTFVIDANGRGLTMENTASSVRMQTVCVE